MANVNTQDSLLVSPILGVRIDPTTYQEVSSTVCRWATSSHSRYICMANVHTVMEAYDMPPFSCVLAQADIVTPDGMPLVWALKLLGVSAASRVYGPDLMPAVLSMACNESIPVGFYGASATVLSSLCSEVVRRFPNLKIAYAFSPPYRPLTKQEDDSVVEAINSSGAKIVFVGLGAPKQEQWMSSHKGRVQAVMLGVGAAFDFLAGTTPQAPRWMMRIGLEWLFRLITEPRRLWKRYLKHNPRFIVLFILQLLTRTL